MVESGTIGTVNFFVLNFTVITYSNSGSPARDVMTQKNPPNHRLSEDTRRVTKKCKNRWPLLKKVSPASRLPVLAVLEA